MILDYLKVTLKSLQIKMKVKHNERFFPIFGNSSGVIPNESWTYTTSTNKIFKILGIHLNVFRYKFRAKFKEEMCFALIFIDNYSLLTF